MPLKEAKIISEDDDGKEEKEPPFFEQVLLKGQALHGRKLELAVHPGIYEIGDCPLVFEAPLPADILSAMSALGFT